MTANLPEPTNPQNYIIGPSGQPENPQNYGAIPPGNVTFNPNGLPFVQVDVYAAGSLNSQILMVSGTIQDPITSAVATAIFQSVTDIASGSGQTVYASIEKRSTAPNVDHRAIFTEAVDNAGGAGSSIAGGRFSAALLLGTSGNGTGATCLATATVAYKYLVGGEGQLFQNTGTDATTAYTAAKFASAILASNLGTNRSDAAFMTNPESPNTSGKGFITGILIATNGRGAGLDTVIDAAFRNDASVVDGIDLTRGAYSGFAIKATGMTVDTSGNTVVASLASTNFLLNNGNVTGSFFGIGGAAVAASTALAIGAGTTGHSQINFAASTAPSVPNNGDWWFDGTNLNIQISGSTKTISHS